MSFDDTLWLWMIIFMNILLVCFEMKNFASNNNQSMAGKLDMYWDPCNRKKFLQKQVQLGIGVKVQLYVSI